jgi:hypothetical protein
MIIYIICFSVFEQTPQKGELVYKKRVFLCGEQEVIEAISLTSLPSLNASTE